MTPSSPTHESIYDRLLTRLRSLGAIDVVAEIEATVNRGVFSGEGEAKSSTPRFFRAMEAEERLVVAVEHLATRLEAPLMLESARITLGQTDAPATIQWRPESERVAIAPPAEMEINQAELRDRLTRLAALAHDLLLTVPEVA